MLNLRLASDASLLLRCGWHMMGQTGGRTRDRCVTLAAIDGDSAISVILSEVYNGKQVQRFLFDTSVACFIDLSKDLIKLCRTRGMGC